MTVDARNPFGESARPAARRTLHVLGAECRLSGDDAHLLDLAFEAFGNLPRHQLAAKPCRLDIALRCGTVARSWPRGAEPPRPALTSGNGLLCATIDAGNFAVVDPAGAKALVCISPSLLRESYYARYELIEFAVLTLAARVQSLVPLHAACVGRGGRGVLLMGGSGTGKSTLALHALAGGLQLLSEDSAFVASEALLVTGTPNYLHLHETSLAFLPTEPWARRIRAAPVIRRRSGAHKFEIDLRELQGSRAPGALRLAASVFLSRRPAGRRPALEPIGRKAFRERLRREQPYAAGLPGWRAFERSLADLPAFELRRPRHPDSAVRELASALDGISP